MLDFGDPKDATGWVYLVLNCLTGNLTEISAAYEREHDFWVRAMLPELRLSVI